MSASLAGAVAVVLAAAAVTAAPRAGGPAAAPSSKPQPAAEAVPPAESAVQPPTPAAPALPKVPHQPEDPRLAQIYAIVDSACAQCHQSGKLTRPYPGGGLADILDVGRLSNEPGLVRRGEPDASRFYQTLLDRHRPVELPSDLTWPDADALLRVRTWIEELKPVTRDCTLVTDADLARAIDDTVRAAGETDAKDLRFVSLANFANACTPSADMEAYRQGLSRLLNSLSWGARPINPAAIGPSNALLVFKLSDIGWIDEHWTALARAEPAGIARDLSKLVTAPGANARVIRADWMAWAASQPPFYAELLGLPQTLDETSRLLGIRPENDAAALHNSRAAIKSSAITHGPRVIERRVTEGRTLWTAYDMLDLFGDREPIERPLGYVAGVPEPYQFRADGKRAMFTLPNGFLAFALSAIDGRRLDQPSSRLDIDAAHVIGTSSAGLACLGCHSAGPKPFLDQARQHIGSDKFTAPREIKDLALSIYPPNADWARILDDDGYRYRRAIIQAGIDPDLLIDGLDPLVALARRYIAPVDLPTAAADAGRAPDALNKALDAVSLSDATLIPRLRQGTLPRVKANDVLASLASPAASREPPVVAALPAPVTAALDLALWTDRATYSAGDLVTIFAKATSACHLTLISVNGTGKATVLYPNEFDQDNLIPPDEPVRVPTPAAQYQFRFKDKGAETVIGTCQSRAQFLPGIEVDYEHQRFTSLGSYENFIRSSFALDTDARRAQATPAPERQRPSRLAAAKETKSDAAKADAKPEETARAAVRLVIE